MFLRTLVLLLQTALAVAFTAAPVAAADGTLPATAQSQALFAGYWDNFFEHWASVFQKQNGIVMVALIVGAVCLFIITRGKWRK
jgi:hypothetical protein